MGVKSTTSFREHFKQHDPVLFAILEQIEPLEEITIVHKDYFVSLCREIIGQQLSTKVARVIFDRFSLLYPKKQITPELATKIPDQKLRDVGLSWSKVSFIKDLAQKITTKTLDLEALEMLSNELVIKELIKVKGIGQWTAEMFLMFSLGKEDVYSHGDYGLQKAMQKLYKLKKLPTRKQAEKISKKWIPYRTYGCLILWKSLEL